MEPTSNSTTNPNAQPGNPEKGYPVGSESRSVAPEVAPAAPQSGPSQPVQLPQIPNVPGQQLPQDPLAAQQPGAAPQPGTPAIAGDVDVIEKEWVDQANKIVAQTKDDPYTEEEAVESLQQDYLKKRYGHDVKKPNQGS
jgi:hypothetical protein